MISQSYLKDEDNSKNENFLSHIISNITKRLTLLGYHSGERMQVDKVFAIVCILFTYLNFLGAICYKLSLIGMLKDIFTFIISVLNLSIFMIDNNIHTIFLLFLFILNIIYIIFFIILFVKIPVVKNTHLIILLLRFYRNFNLLNYWILYSVELELSLLIIFVPSLNGITSLHKYIAIFNFIICFFIALIYAYFCNKIEFNFESRDYLSRLDSRAEILILWIKTLFSLNFFLYYYLSFSTNLYLSLCLILSIILLWFMTTYSFYYYNLINVLFLFFNLSLIWSILSIYIISNFPTLGDLYFVVLIGYISLYPISKHAFGNYWRWLLSKIPFVELKEGHIVCKYVSILISLICQENLSESDKLMLLGIVKQHELNCVYEKCVCQAEDGLKLVIPKNEVVYLKSNDSFGVEKSKVYFIHLVKNIFEFLLIVTRNGNINLTIMFAYFMYFYIGNYYYSLSVLLNLKKMNNINIQQTTSLNRILQMIAQKVEEINSNPVNKIELDGKISFFKVDFNRIINFYEKITTLRTSISFALDYSLNFWNCILNKVEIDVIKKNGLEFYKHHNKIEETFKEINLIYDQLQEINELYYNYKNHVFGDIKKYNFRQSLNFELKEKDKFFNNRSTIIIANLTDRNKAIIEKISENIKTFLGYNPSECLGQDVKLLMPNYFKMKHSGFINNHFESGVSKITNKERQIMALHAKGYSIPINLSIKLLPNLGANIFYVGFMREFTVDYDFIITSPKGKIEMLSKGVYSHLINPHIFNFLDYYIHFLCKEYLDEINQIFEPNYSISDFSNAGNITQKYNYSLLHFHKEVNIEKILFDFKKNDNTNQQGLDTFQNAMSTPISKIYSLKGKIKNNFKKDSLKKFTILENFNILSNEELKLFKLYTHINTDLIANVEEMQLIEGYLQGYGQLTRVEEKDEENENLTNPQFVSKMSFPMNILTESISQKETFKYSALVKEKYNPNEKQYKKQKAFNYDTGSSTSSLSSHVSLDYYKQYQSIMKRYSSKNTYEEIHYIIFLNVLFLILILLLIIVNHIMNYKGIINIFSAINNEYFSLFNIYPALTDIKKNIISILNVKNNLINTSLFDFNYTEVAFTDITNFYEEFDISRKFILNSSFDFSGSFVDNLFKNLTIIEPNYLNIQVSLNQAFISLSTYIGYLTNINLINPESNYIKFLLLNLNTELYNQIMNLLNGSLDDTKLLITKLVKAKEIFYLVIILLVAGLGGFIYSHILCYYCKQNRMISLLLSIEQESSREIIDSIRVLKSTIYQKDSDPLEEEKLEEEENLKVEESKKTDKNELKKENRKTINLGNDKKESISANKIIKKKSRASKLNNVISPKVYIGLFSKILFIICITLIPFITGKSISFYDDKSMQIIDLIINSNYNEYYYIITLLNYQELIYSNDNLTERLTTLRSNINTFRNNQFLTSNLLYQTLNGLSNTNEFHSYYDSKFCNNVGTKINSTFDCVDQNGAYTNYGFQYVINININIIDQLLTNNDFTIYKNESMIKMYFSDPNYILSEKTYDIMMREGFKVYTKNLKSTITSFMNAYENQFLIIFIFCIICLIFNQLISVLFMRYIIRAVNFELKNIFSLMPYLIFLTNPNINNLLSK